MPTILIVDDDSVDRQVAVRCLGPIEGLTVLQAEEGAEALQAIARTHPDIVLTDLRMPGMNGLELIEQIRADHSGLPVILMTSRGNEKIAVEALRAGAASYVPKDELTVSLRATVRQVLEMVEARRIQRRLLRHLTHSDIRFELVNDPTLIAPLVAFFHAGLDRLGFGDQQLRTQVSMALTEALANAMIHGNLEIDSELRRGDRSAYDELVAKRREEEPYMARRVAFESKIATDRLEYVVRDEGPGFDPSELPDPTVPDNVLKVSGRGLWLIHTFMDEVEFNERGNRIRMIKHAPQPVSA